MRRGGLARKGSMRNMRLMRYAKFDDKYTQNFLKSRKETKVVDKGDKYFVFLMFLIVLIGLVIVTYLYINKHLIIG